MTALAGPFDILTNPAEEFAEYLRDKTFEALNYLVKTAESFLTDPPRPDIGGDWATYLFGNFWGLAQQVSILVAIVFGLVVILVRSRGKQTLQALGMAALIGVGGGVFYLLAYYATTLGDQLAAAAMFHQSPNALVLAEGPVYDNALLAFVLMGFAALLAFILILQTIVFVYIGLFIQILGVLLLSLLIVGRFGQTMWRWALSIGLVSVVFGRAISAFSLEFGQLGIDNLPPDSRSALLAVLIMMGALLMAILLPILMILASNLMLTKLQGGQSSSTVEGDVDTREQNDEQRLVEVQAADASHRRSMLDIEDLPSRTSAHATHQLPGSTIQPDAAAGAAIISGAANVVGPAGTAVKAATELTKASAAEKE